MLSEMVISIKEENASQASEERKQRDAMLANKMRIMKHLLQEKEQKRAKMAKVREEILKVDHPNYDKFKKAMQIDAKNEQCPVPRRKSRRPLERTNSWVW
jgi:hypothetical protein